MAMEAEGFRRGLHYLLFRGVDIGMTTTDRYPSIRKIMREDYSHIRHEFDPWHVNKSKNLIYNIKNNVLAVSPL